MFATRQGFLKVEEELVLLSTNHNYLTLCVFVKLNCKRDHDGTLVFCMIVCLLMLCCLLMFTRRIGTFME